MDKYARVIAVHDAAVSFTEAMVLALGYSVVHKGKGTHHRLVVGNDLTIRVSGSMYHQRGEGEGGYRFRPTGEADVSVFCCLGEGFVCYVVPTCLWKRGRIFTIPGADPDWGGSREDSFREAWHWLDCLALLDDLGAWIDSVNKGVETVQS